MSRPRQTVEKALRSHLPPRGRLLLGVSGGVDSMCLLHGCQSLAKRLKVVIEVAHVDHGLRHGSRDDADFVERHCVALGIPIHVCRAPSKPKNRNTEDWGRSIRYKYFKKILGERSLECVLTAHTANDVAETLLMKLLSGKELRTIMRKDDIRRCVRPLLDVSRAEIETYAKTHGVPFVEDPTNEDTSLLRNRVRRSLIPFLESQFDPRIVELISRRAGALAEDEEALDSSVAPATRRVGGHMLGSREWLRAARLELGEMSPNLHWRFALAILKSELGFRVGRKKCEEFLDVLWGKSIGTELPGGKMARAHRGGLKFL